MTADRRVAPEFAVRSGHAFFVQRSRDGARADAGRELAEYPADDIRLGFIDLAITAKASANCCVFAQRTYPQCLWVTLLNLSADQAQTMLNKLARR
ncbi:hypothetical protein [Brucella sp. 09RB8910]|uniref:hypothetical protein n=1 Tax=Brucella sp. 09RB8910 TaxID=1844051 RepID=UPI001FFCC847|nr:hypothetical protein [Brucella sp. 09RB8910]